MELTRCLIVDDEAVGRELISTYMEKVKTVDTAVDGNEAIEKFKAAHEAGEPYQLVLLDIVLPDMSGISVGKTMRTIERVMGLNILAQVKIVMLTSLKGAQDVMQAMMEAQSSAYLVKPVDQGKVRETLSKIGLSMPR